MQTLQFLDIRQYYQLVFCPGGCHINQFFIIFQPVISSLISLLGDCQRKKHNIFFISLKCMNRSTGNIFHPIVFQRLVNQLFLIGKRSNDTNALIRMFFDKRNNLFHFLRRCILIVGGICWNILKNQWISFFIRTVDNQLVVIIFFIIK